MKYHKTNQGIKIPISELSDTHLKNIIKYIKRRSKEGVKVVFSYGGFTCIDSMYYKEEAKKRGL